MIDLALLPLLMLAHKWWIATNCISSTTAPLMYQQPYTEYVSCKPNVRCSLLRIVQNTYISGLFCVSNENLDISCHFLPERKHCNEYNNCILMSEKKVYYGQAKAKKDE